MFHLFEKCLKERLFEELHKSVRKNFKRRRVILKGLDDLWQADLVEMGAYSSRNKGCRYLLTVIDGFSKYTWCISIKNKSGVDVSKAMLQIFKRGRVPKNLQTDDGTEF